MAYDPEASVQSRPHVRGCPDWAAKRGTRGRLAAAQRGKWGGDTAHHDALLHRYGEAPQQPRVPPFRYGKHYAFHSGRVKENLSTSPQEHREYSLGKE